jgi:hypothetical protein
VYAAQQWPEQMAANPIQSPQLLDPTLLRAARLLYRAYQEVHRERMDRPVGVAINRLTHRGQLIFRGKPILLFTESFVPFEQIESGLY